MADRDRPHLFLPEPPQAEPFAPVGGGGDRTKPFNWPQAIAAAVLIRQEMQDIDRDGLYRYDFPEVAAQPATLERLEAERGTRLDRQHRDFLLYADGWRCFYQHVSILSSQLRGGDLVAGAEKALDVLDQEGVLGRAGVDRRSLLPVAASAEQSDVFAVCLGGVKAGQVLWLAGDLVDTFPDFQEYFLAMLDYLHDEYQDFVADLQT